jgi:hypothetical protein
MHEEERSQQMFANTQMYKKKNCTELCYVLCPSSQTHLFVDSVFSCLPEFKTMALSMFASVAIKDKQDGFGMSASL